MYNPCLVLFATNVMPPGKSKIRLFSLCVEAQISIGS